MRIAGIRFINALPLIYGLEKNPLHQIFLETPSVCYKKLLNREVDLALIPIFGTQTSLSIQAFRGLGIAAESCTESVFLFCKKTPDQIRNVATDPASLTSITLLKIILNRRYGNTPQFLPDPYSNVKQTLEEYDAVMVIGDSAILADKSDYQVYDLATEWYSLTGLPFLFAVWASNRPLSEAEKQDLIDSYLLAIQHWDEIYERANRSLQLNGRFLKRYYNNDLHYRLTERDYEGFLKFIHLSAELKIIEKVREEIWM
jgi:chorismate dehydratase